MLNAIRRMRSFGYFSRTFNATNYRSRAVAASSRRDSCSSRHVGIVWSALFRNNAQSACWISGERERERERVARSPFSIQNPFVIGHNWRRTNSWRNSIVFVLLTRLRERVFSRLCFYASRCDHVSTHKFHFLPRPRPCRQARSVQSTLRGAGAE